MKGEKFGVEKIASDARDQKLRQLVLRQRFMKVIDGVKSKMVQAEVEKFMQAIDNGEDIENAIE